MPTTINRGSERQLKVTVGQVQAGKAVLLTDDLQILEVPASLLPLNTGGSPCLTLTLSPREDSNDRLQSLVTKLKDGPAKAAESLKEAIERDGFLYVHHRSHCTVTARWASYASLPLSKYGQLFGIDGYVNGHKMIGSHIDAIGDDETELRLTGLSPNSDYDVQLVFRTATGTFRSRSIRVHTPALDDFSGLSIAVDSQWPSEERQRVHGIIKVRSLQLSLNSSSLACCFM
jgi:hypothetical protein